VAVTSLVTDQTSSVGAIKLSWKERAIGCPADSC
jgi:hypothetical protein